MVKKEKEEGYLLEVLEGMELLPLKPLGREKRPRCGKKEESVGKGRPNPLCLRKGLWKGRPVERTLLPALAKTPELKILRILLCALSRAVKVATYFPSPLIKSSPKRSPLGLLDDSFSAMSQSLGSILERTTFLLSVLREALALPRRIRVLWLHPRKRLISGCDPLI